MLTNKNKYLIAIFLIGTFLFIRVYSIRGLDWEKLCKNCFDYDLRLYYPKHWYFFYNVRNLLGLTYSPLKYSEFSMNTNNNNMFYYIDYIKQYPGTIDIIGWAYIKKTSGFQSTTNIVLSSEHEKFFFPSRKIKREDIVRIENDSNLLMSGFDSFLNLNTIPSNYYRLGILINSGQLHELKYSDYIMDIGKMTEKLFQKKNQHDILCAIDFFNENDDFFEIKGWALIKGLEQIKINCILLLYTSEERYLFAMRKEFRPDVNSVYNLPLTDSAGFFLRFSKEKIPAGTYSTGIIITSDTLKNQLLLLEKKLIISDPDNSNFIIPLHG